MRLRSASSPATATRVKRAWVAGYGLGAAVPLFVVSVVSPDDRRGFVIELAAALGIVALSLLTLQLILPARLGVIVRPLGADVAIRMHRHLADVVVAAVAGHIALVMVDRPADLALLNPLGAPWRAKVAIASCVALTALIASSLLRRRLRLSYARWRGAHVALAIATVALGAAHALGAQRHRAAGVAGVFMLALAAVGVIAVLQLRVARPRRLSRRPYRVEHVAPERGGAVTLMLSAEGHGGRPFRPGQFAWLKAAGVPRALAEHPFSYASSATRPDRPAFTIKAYGGFTRTVAHYAPGMRVLIDGPHGAFSAHPSADRFVFIVGGIGITPVMSLLRTAADLGDPRPHLLIYGSPRWEDVTFREELEQLERRLDLGTVHVLSEPAPDWTGESGRVDAALLARHLPADARDAYVYLAGPPPMVTAILQILHDVGAPADHVHAEQFVLV